MRADEPPAGRGYAQEEPIMVREGVIPPDSPPPDELRVNVERVGMWVEDPLRDSMGTFTIELGRDRPVMARGTGTPFGPEIMMDDLRS